MSIVKAERKFSIYSQFLDTTLTAEEERLPGESIEDGEMRIISALERTADRLRKQANPHLYQEDLKQKGLEELRPHIPEPNWRQSQVPIIDKSTEKLEIQIDNANSLEDLAKIKESCGKSGLMSLYMKRLNELMIKISDTSTIISKQPLTTFPK